jgi:hypothetical protein
MTPDDPRHGTDRGHATHMRTSTPPCKPCRAAHTRMNKLRKLYPERYKRAPAIGSRRRLQALQALGYGRTRLATELGYVNAGAIAYLMSNKSQTVTQAVDRRVREVYDRLSMLPPPTGAGPTRARTWARRRGFAVPLAWDDNTIDDPSARPHGNYAQDDHARKTDIDPVAIERTIAGDRIQLTRAERFEVVTRMRAAGWSLVRIEAHTGITKPERYIEREAVA